jgi:hypothetical protein
MPKNVYGQLWMLGFSSQTIISKLQTVKEFIDGWM